MPSRLSLVPHAVVLCGPQGAPALHPLPGPPALLHIGNEPAVGYLLRALEAAGTRSAILVSLSLAFCVRGEAGGLRALLNVAAMQAPMYGLYARGVRGVDSDGGRLVTRREQAHAFRRPTHPIPVPSSILLTLTHATVSLSSRTHTHTHTHTRTYTQMCATDQVASKVGAWAAKHWPPTSRLALSVRTAPPGSGSGGALASALAALDLPPGSPLTIAPADLVTEGEPLGRAFLSHFKAGATLTALLAHRRASPATETKPGRAPRGVTYVALAGGGSRQAGAGDDGAATLAEAEPTLLHLALPPADPGAPPGREVSIPLAALAAAAAASASAGGAGTAALTLRSDLAASGLYVLDAGAAAGGLATLAARAAGGGGGAGSVSVGRDLVPYLLRRQFTPRDPSASEEGGGGAGGPDEAAKAAVAAPPADAATTTMTSTTAPASSAAAPPPRPVCQAHLAPRSRVCGRASTVQAYLELNRDVAAADAGLREGGGRGGGASAAGADGPAPAGGPPSASAPPPASIHPSTSLGAKAAVSLASIVGPDCVLGDRCSVKKSVLGSGVTVGKGAKVANCVLGAGAVVGENAAIQNSVICAGGRVGSRAVVRDARVGPGAEVGEGDELVEETVGGDLAVGSL